MSQTIDRPTRIEDPMPEPQPHPQPTRHLREARTRPYLLPGSTPERAPDWLHILFVVAQVALDLLAIGFALYLTYVLRLESLSQFNLPSPELYAGMLVVASVAFLIVFNFYGLYRLRRGTSRIDEFYKIVAAVSSGIFVALALNFLLLGDRFVYSRQILVLGWFLCIAFVTITRFVYGTAVGALRQRGVARQRMLIIGTGTAARMVWERVNGAPTLGYEVVGFLEGEHDREEEAANHPAIRERVLGYVDEISNVVQTYNIDEVVVALPGYDQHDVLDIVAALGSQPVNIRFYPDIFQLIIDNRAGSTDLNGLTLYSVRDVTLRGTNRLIKRAFDIVFSFLVLVAVSPIMLLTALLIKLESSGPVFFVQERVGLDGQPIQVIKFRSMRADAEKLGTWTTQNDPRRTRIGTLIRRLSIDELPQFVNVLIGEMSVVGPRPEQPHYVAQFAASNPLYHMRHREKTGITGLAQVNGLRGDTSIEERTRYDIIYVENWSVLLDLKIIARTIMQVLTGRNAY